MSKGRFIGASFMLLGFGLLAWYAFDLWQAVETTITQMRAGGWWEHVLVFNTFSFLLRCPFYSDCQDVFGRGITQFRSLWPYLWMVGAASLGVGGITFGFSAPEAPDPYDAHFACPGEVKHLKLDLRDRYIVPLVRFRRRFFGLEHAPERYKQLRHALIMAPTQSGKSVHAKSVLVAFRGSMIAVDIKGELRRDTSGARAELGQVVTLHPRGLGHRYDPLVDIGEDVDALRAVAELLVIDPRDKDPVFAQRAVPAVIAGLRGAQLTKQAAIPYLHALTSEGPQAFVERLTSLNDRHIRDMLTVYLAMPPEQFRLEAFADPRGFVGSSWGTLMTRLEPFFAPGIRKLMSGSDVRAKDFAERPTTLYLVWPEELLRSASRPLSLILHGLITGLCKDADQLGKPELPTLLLLDEAPHYPVPALPTYIATMLGRGISALLYTQSAAQLVASYGREHATTLEDNCHAELYFSPTHETAKRLSEKLGFMTVSVASSSKTRGFWEPETLSERPMRRELMTTDELTRLPEDEAILLVRGLRPVRAKRIKWYRHVELWRRMQTPPLSLQPIPDLLLRLTAPTLPQLESDTKAEPQPYSDPDEDKEI